MTSTSLSNRKMTELGPKAFETPDTLPRQKMAPQRVGWLIAVLIALIAGLVGGLGTWAVLTPMQSAVLAAGQFGVQGNRLVIQHLEGGIVRSIEVLEGEKVNQGDVIAKLDDTRPRAALLILQNQLASMLATEMRLKAEFGGSDTMAISSELTAMIQQDPSLQSVVEVEQDLFHADRHLLTGRIEILHSRIAQLERQQNGVLERITAQNNQLAILQEDLETSNMLLAEGLITRSRDLAMRRDEAGLIGDIAISHTDLQMVGNQISEQKETRLQITRDELTSIADQRQRVSQTLNDLRQRVTAAQDVLARTVITAPRSGTIIGLKINTLGEVLEDGEVVTEILPDNTSIVVDVMIQPDDIDQVTAGGIARVRLTAFNYRTTPTVLGRVVRVSPDSVVDPLTNLPTYRAQVVLEPGELEQLPDVAVLPGMQAQVMIATGEQTLADYLAAPILSGIEVAMTDNM